ncbi:hypothetical protein [uncultured Pseudomonas sp.]|uniref:hypothetical protein n=1 Tax=uncultured Pseudomonas sp. TaxID=114707 RepID=UPI0025840DAA|nr:hypothetical protein [uncultured Pseudomonas sp.]
MNIVLYAPQEIPKTLTARVAISHLGEHLRAFLNANNISNWAPDEEYVLRDDKLADVLVTLGTAKGMTIAQMKYQAKKVLKLAKAGGAKIQLGHSYSMVANCLGYRDFRTSLQCRSVDNYVDNLWLTGVLLRDGLLASERPESWPSSRITDELRARMRFNKTRSNIVNQIKKRGRKARSQKEQEFLEAKRKEISKRATAPIESRD